jgi:hypothetical protein
MVCDGQAGEGVVVGGVGGPPGGGKIGGPPPVGTPDVKGPTGPEGPRGASFGEALQKTSGAEKAEKSAEAAPLDRLRSGEIDAQQYADLRVREATAHLDGLLAPADLERVRAELHDLIAQDPDVAALVKAAEIGR